MTDSLSKRLGDFIQQCAGSKILAAFFVEKRKLESEVKNMKEKYTVFVDDNFHYMDEDERYQLGEFDTLEEAITECKAVVDRSLADLVGQIKENPNAEKLYGMYVCFGEDPWISHPTESGLWEKFSAWAYAKEQAKEMCRK